MLDEYTGAFSRYLRTGTVGALSGFLAEDADPARLRVYRNGFLKACIEALRASYPSVERLVGEERFPALARPYVDAHPPRAASLVEYGERFPKFVEDTVDTHRLAYLAAFARLESRVVRSLLRRGRASSGRGVRDRLARRRLRGCRDAGDIGSTSCAAAAAIGAGAQAERFR